MLKILFSPSPSRCSSVRLYRLGNRSSVQILSTRAARTCERSERRVRSLERGVRVKIVRSDWNLYSKAVTEGVPDMYYRSWYADYPHAENFLSPLFESGVSQRRWTRYSSEDLDKLIHKIQSTLDDKKQGSYVNQANSILIKDVPWVYLWHTRTPYISQPNLRGWLPSLMFNAEKYVKVLKK